MGAVGERGGAQQAGTGQADTPCLLAAIRWPEPHPSMAATRRTLPLSQPTAFESKAEGTERALAWLYA